jgi:hypothetical protein
MNFQEFIDKLPPEDRQLVIDHFVRNILGQGQKEEVVIRRTAKISTLGTEEEIIQEISQAFKFPVEQIKNQNIAQKLKEIGEGYHRTSALIDKYKDFLTAKIAKKDKFEELYDIGKFLASLNINATLEIPENLSAIPDFIVSVDKKRIGIEHTRLININSQIWIKTVSQILKKSESILLNRNPELKQIVNISVNYWKININGKGLSDKLTITEKDQIANEIADYVESLINKRELQQPSFIDMVSISERSEHPLNLILNENYIAKSESAKLFEERISDKETKLGSYLANNSLDELWLLVVISGVSAPSSFNLEKHNTFETKFDKVFLFDAFSCDNVICKN